MTAPFGQNQFALHSVEVSQQVSLETVRMVQFARRAHAIAREAIGVIGGRPRSAKGISEFFRSLNIWFWAIVGLPTLLAAIYYFAVAADLYASQIIFVVRGPAKPAVSLGSLLGGGGMPAPAEDTFAVHEFIRSRDAVRKLDQLNGLRAVLNRPEGDLFTRFPGIIAWRNDFEALYKTYGHFVSVDMDTSSGVSTLLVKAYRPEDAQMIARALFSYSEQLVNELNERARKDALATFQHEVDIDEERIANIQRQLTAYRVKEKMLDPKSASAGPLELLAQMNAQYANSKAQLAEALKNARNSPQIPLIKTRIATLEKLISEERAKISGDTNSVVASLSEYEYLNMRLQLAEKNLASAFTSLASARLEAQRQQLYMETIAQPNFPDYPLYPKRIVSFATVVASCLMVYGISWLLIAGVREHAAP